MKTGRKGIATIIAIGIAVLIVTIGAFISMIIPTFFLKRHLIEIIIFEYEYDNTQAALLSLVSLNETDSLDGKVKPVPEIIGKFVTLRKKPDINFLEDRLEQMVEHKLFECYKLTSKKAGVLAESDGCEPSKYKAKIVIALPYDQLTDELELVVD